MLNRLENFEDLNTHLSKTYKKVLNKIKRNKTEIQEKLPEKFKPKIKQNFNMEKSLQLTQDGKLTSFIAKLQKP